MKRLSVALVFFAWFVTPASADLDAGMAAYGRGDYATALREFSPPAEKGDGFAQFSLGILYAEGQGVPQDYQEAIHWYRLAAEQGYDLAQYSLGLLYAKGQGVPRNYQEAIRWYRLAAEQGSALAQFNLGRMYRTGQGVPQDYVQAHMWANLAAAQNHKNALVTRNLIAKKMSQSQIAEAQRLAREWKPKQ